jgi:hypothetical protein
MRSFLKAKDNDIKLSGYSDVGNYDLGHILSLEDFESEDAILIGQAITVANFRSASFLSRVTDERGLLRLVGGISDFQLTAQTSPGSYEEPMVYNAHRDGESVRLIPELNGRAAKRDMAKDVAASWGGSGERYCFSVDVQNLEEMLQRPGCRAIFPSLNYSKPSGRRLSRARIAKSRSRRFAVEGYLTDAAPGNAIKQVLRNHGVSMTGRKDQLAEKLAKLSAKVYIQRKPELDLFFRERRFIRAKNVGGADCVAFPVLEDLDLKGMVLTMYAMKHLRGNVVLDVSHENDAFDLQSLAKALVKREVTLDGSFLPAA